MVAKYPMLKHDRGGPAPAVDFAPMDQWTPAGELSAGLGPSGKPTYEWLEVRSLWADSPTVTG